MSSENKFPGLGVKNSRMVSKSQCDAGLLDTSCGDWAFPEGKRKLFRDCGSHLPPADQNEDLVVAYAQKPWILVCVMHKAVST